MGEQGSQPLGYGTGGRTLTLPTGTVVGGTTAIASAAGKKTAIAWTYNGSGFTFVLAAEV